MKVFAPGKLVVTGAYAVLEGAPAISLAVSRGAFADASRAALEATSEVKAALDAIGSESTVAPHADASAMFVGARKLGLGASSAILVASLAALDLRSSSPADLSDPAYRARLIARAREAHALAQGGGSGVDVATSVWRRPSLRDGRGAAAGEPARGSRRLRLRVWHERANERAQGEIDRLGRRDAPTHRARMEELGEVARVAAAAMDVGDGAAFVEAHRRTARALARLGEAADVGIVPEGFASLEALAAREEASFAVSGAGGGDVAVFLGRAKPSAAFVERAHSLGLFSLDLTLDQKGVRVAPVALAQATSEGRA